MFYLGLQIYPKSSSGNSPDATSLYILPNSAILFISSHGSRAKGLSLTWFLTRLFEYNRTHFHLALSTTCSRQGLNNLLFLVSSLIQAKSGLHGPSTRSI